MTLATRVRRPDGGNLRDPVADEYSIHAFSIFPDRVARMDARFFRVGLSINWEADQLTADDPRNLEKSRLFAVMRGHLGALRSFLGTGRAYGVICEDDVLIRRTFVEDLAFAIRNFESLGLDLLLLGYLLPFKPETASSGDGSADPPFVFLSYPEDLWGSEMYLVSRRSALEITEKFHDSARVQGPYSPDWTITKHGKRACIYPMLAVEEGESHGGSDVHARFHRACHVAQFDPELHF